MTDYCEPVRTELPVRTMKGLGWKPDLPDIRDQWKKPRLRRSPLPPVVRLHENPWMPDPYDQDQLGSCTANAIGGAIEYTLGELGLAPFTPSRLAIYYGERTIEGTVNSDDGAYIRDGFKVINAEGCAPEELWPYDQARFREQPPPSYYEKAAFHKCLDYGRVDQVASAFMGALADGDPIVFGFSVYSSFANPEVARTGFCPMPGPDDRVEGGHAVLMVGYEVIEGVLYAWVRNSWGKKWGQNGYFLIPMEYVTNPNLANDFWRLTLVQ